MSGASVRTDMKRPAFWLGWCAALAACGGGGAMGDDDGGGDDVPADASGGGDGAGGGDEDRRLYPLEEGRVWSYDVTSTYPSCPGGRRDHRVIGKGTTDGREAFRVSSYCGLTITTSAEGNRVETFYDFGPRGWYRYLDEPVEDGRTWTTTNGSATFTQTYEQLGAYEGHEGCWKITQNVSYTSYWIHCEGVGLVHAEMIDLGGGVIRARLVEQNF